MNVLDILHRTERQRVADGAIATILDGWAADERLLLLVWSQLGDFDSLEYAWWLQRDRARLAAAKIAVRAVGIGDRAAGQQFCAYTGFDDAALFVDPKASLHRDLELYAGLAWQVPGFAPAGNAWLNLLMMCAGIGSPGTLGEVWRGYRGDRAAPQLFGDDEIVKATPLPAFPASLFALAGGRGFQRPLELATLRLRNMAESLGHWRTYVPDAAYLTQRGATFLFDPQGQLLYEHRDRGILGFAADMSQPLSFLNPFLTAPIPVEIQSSGSRGAT